MRIITIFFTTGILLLCSPALADDPMQKTAQEKTTTIICYQNGQKIIHEENLTSYRPGETGLYGKKPDGTWVTITGVDGDSGTVCKILDEPDQLQDSE